MTSFDDKVTWRFWCRSFPTTIFCWQNSLPQF